MPLIHLELSWYKNCVLTDVNANAGNVEFKIKETKSYVPIVTLPTRDNAK